ITPASRTSIPLEARPAAIADSSISPDARVSLPTTTFGEIAFLTSTRAAACASFRADAAVIGSLFAVPRTPSVPKSFCDTGYLREADPRDQLVIGGSGRGRLRGGGQLNKKVEHHKTVLLNSSFLILPSFPPARGRRSNPMRSGETSTFFFTRYQTAVATIKDISFARQFSRKSRFITSRRCVRLRQRTARVAVGLVAIPHQEFGKTFFELARLEFAFNFASVTDRDTSGLLRDDNCNRV